mmetsp:Transcript_49719/g.106241  ORF Transcript_49719/g.106241 Transcript_49719/m.106241 type:complete len:214 (-) Transcript_49719:136-777(-)
MSIIPCLGGPLAASITSCHTSFGQLPVDVLHSLVPHLLMCRMPDMPYDWAVSNHMYHLLLDQRKSCRMREDIGYVARYAWLPILRIKLVSKYLHSAVDAYLSSILQPEPRCSQAAAAVQRFVKARSSWVREMTSRWAGYAHLAEHGNRNGYLELGVPSAVLRRQQYLLEIVVPPQIHFMVFGGIDYSVLDGPEPLEDLGILWNSLGYDSYGED